MGELKSIDEDAATELRRRLLAQKGDYSFSLDLSFPPEALRKAFLLDQPKLKNLEVADKLWEKYLEALRMFDQTVPVRGKQYPLSALVGDKGIAHVRSGFLSFKGASKATSFPVPTFDGKRLPEAANEVWFFVRSGHDFIEACVRARKALLSDKPAKKVNEKLRKMSRAAASAPGTFGDRIDAKYLSLALVEGPELSSVTTTLKRGRVSVTL